MNKLDKMGKPETLLLDVSLGIASFLFLFSFKTGWSDFRLNFSELLLTLLILIFLGGATGFSWHYCEVNKKKFSAVNLDLKAIVIYFLYCTFP